MQPSPQQSQPQQAQQTPPQNLSTVGSQPPSPGWFFPPPQKYAANGSSPATGPAATQTTNVLPPPFTQSGQTNLPPQPMPHLNEPIASPPQNPPINAIPAVVVPSFPNPLLPNNSTTQPPPPHSQSVPPPTPPRPVMLPTSHPQPPPQQQQQQQSSERILLSNASQMAQQYYNENNFEMARRFLDSIAISYRHEQWRSILTTITLTALDCAMRMDDRLGAIQYSLELLGANLLVTPQQKQLIMNQMLGLAYTATPTPTAGPNPSAQNIVLSTVFEVDRRHAILSATSHFVTLPNENSSLVTSMKDVSVCVGDEFDLILNISVGFPVATHFNRMDVYFYCPTATATGTQINLAPPTNSPSGSRANTPYHLVLLPGGATIPVHNPDNALGQTPSDQSFTLLRPDQRGHVHTDLNFPSASLSQAAMTPKPGQLAFTFGTAPPPTNTIKPSVRSYRIRMKATVATASHSNTILPNAASTPVATTPVATPSNNLLAGAPSSLFPTSLVASLTVPPPASSSLAPRALQFRADIVPNRGGVEEKIVPVSVIEERERERAEAEKKAKKKGLTLPPVERDQQPIRTPTLRILPPHAKARIELIHPPLGLIGEYMPLVVRIQSEGDDVQQGELTLFSTISGNTTASASTVPSPNLSPRLTPSTSMDSLSGLNETSSASIATTGGEKGISVSLNNVVSSTDGATPPGPLSRSNSFLGVDSPVSGTDGTLVGVKFYRLASGFESRVGVQVQDPSFDELSTTAPITIPHIQANQAHMQTIYLKSLTAGTPLLSFTLSYQTPSGQKLSVVHTMNTLQFKVPWRVKMKVFEDELSGLSAPNLTTSANSNVSSQRLILGAKTLCHVELENVAGVPLKINQLQLDLPTKFFGNQIVNKPIRECITPMAARAIKDAKKVLDAHGHSSITGTNTIPTICVGPGEKYTHLFNFAPMVAGKTHYTPLQIRWNRITPYLDVPLATVSGVASESKDQKDGTSVVSSHSQSSPCFFPTPAVQTRKDLPAFHILRAPISLSINLPPTCVFGSTVDMRVDIRNDTDQIHEVELIILDLDSSAPPTTINSTIVAPTHTGHTSHIKLVFSGPTKEMLRVRAHATEQLHFRICPLECGLITLPKIQLKAVGLGGTTPAPTMLLMDPNDTGVLFVHPKSKQLSESSTSTAAHPISST